MCFTSTEHGMLMESMERLEAWNTGACSSSVPQQGFHALETPALLLPSQIEEGAFPEVYFCFLFYTTVSPYVT